jgi:AcrR family transcriptional regulator
VADPTQPDSSSQATPPIDDRIVHAALALINEHGLGGVTMSQVADAAGVARQTLYNRYGDIDSIVATTIERHNQESLDLLASAITVTESPEDRLEQLVRHFASIGAHSHHSVDLLGALASELRAGLDAYRHAIEEHIRAIIDEGMRADNFRSDLSLDIDTGLIRSVLEGVRYLAARTPDQAAQISTTGTRTILRALR